MAATEELLALLSKGPSHGYDLKRAHDEWFGQGKALAFGQVYATLGRLERDGLADLAGRSAGEGPERTVYEITADGRRRLAQWIDEASVPAPPGGGDLVRRTVVAVRLGLDVEALVARQRAEHLRRMRALQDEAGDDVLARLVVDHATAHLDADLRWLDAAAAVLRSSGTTTRGTS